MVTVTSLYLAMTTGEYSIEYVPGGHIGGVKQENYFPLGKSFILMQKYFYCLLLQHGRRAQTLLAVHACDCL